MILETKDLIIRPSVWADLEYFYPWEQDPAVTEFFSIRDGQTMEDCAKKFIGDEEDPGAMQFTVIFFLPLSRASVLEKPSIAVLAAE